jgi:hypothetical protein
MRWSWFSRPIPQRLRGTSSRRRARSAQLGVRRLERRRVLDASVTSLVAAQPVVQNGDTLTMHEADPLQLTATADGLGTLFFDWTLKKNGTEIDSIHQSSTSGQSVVATFSVLDDNEFNGDVLEVELRVSDAAQTYDIETRTLSVLNVPPTVDLSGNSSVDEGTPYSLTVGPVMDPGTDTVSQYSIDWGDGQSSPFTAAELNGLGRVVTHTYANGPSQPTITIDLADEDGTYQDVDSLTIEVLDLDTARITDFPTPATIFEGNTLTASATASGLGTLFFDWSLKRNGTEIDSLHQTGTSGQPVTATFFLADDNEFNGDDLELELRVSDSAQTFDIETRTVTVLNVAPTVDLSGNPSVDEGTPYTLTIGPLVDPGTDTVSLYTVHWGDGQTNMYTPAELGPNRQVTHTYANGPNNYLITIDLSDEDGTYTEVDSLAVQVLDVETATITDFPTPPAIFEGNTLTVTATATGFGTLFFDWSLKKNGVEIDAVHQTGTSGQPVSTTFFMPDDNENGDLIEVELRVSDSAQTFDIETRTVTVLNVAPDVELSGNPTVDIGATYQLTVGPVVDPGTDTVSQYIIHWGDGQDSVLTAAQLAELGRVVSHAYMTGPVLRTITIDLVDEDGTYLAVDSLPVNVLVPPATITDFPTPETILEGSTLTATATATGFGTLFFDWSLKRNGMEIDSLHQTATSGELVTATFFLADDNENGDTLELELRVSDSAQTFDLETRPVTVLNVAPTLELTGNASVNEGSVYLLTIGSVVDPGTDTVTTYTIHWGDGQTTPFTAAEVDGASRIVSHTYADGLSFPTITLDLVDEDGTYLIVDSLPVTVNNVAPIAPLSGIPEISEGMTYVLSIGAVVDPGTDVVTQYLLTWGDGSTQTLSAAEIDDLGRAVSHLFMDNDSDNLNPITLSLLDEDGQHLGSPFVMTIFNVNPSLLPVAASDVNTLGQTTLQLTFSDPGRDNFRVMVDWGEFPLSGEDHFVEAGAFNDGTTPVSLSFVHQYTGPPDPLNPTADITIRVMIFDDDQLIAGVVQPGISNEESVIIGNPGISTPGVAIDTTPNVPRLSFAAASPSAVFIPEQAAATQTLQTALGRVAGGEAAATAERYLRLCVIRPDGEIDKCFRIKDEALYDLRGFFASLPDNRYRIFVVRTANKSQRLVIEVDVRRGQLIDPTDESEGTRDRPPTSERLPDKNAVPLEQNPLLQQLFDQAPPAGGDRSASVLEPDAAAFGAAAPDATNAECDCAAAKSQAADIGQRGAAAVVAAGLVGWSQRVDAALELADERSWLRLRRAGRLRRFALRNKKSLQR